MGTEMKNLNQQILNFDFEQNFKDQDFYVSKSNEYSFKLLSSWPKWEKNFVNLIEESDLCITRAGATSLAEISIMNKPFIAVPLPTSKDNHQMENASYLYEKNASWILQESEEFPLNLFNLLKEILEKKEIVDEKKGNLEKIEIKPSEQIIFKEVNAWYE